MPANAVAVASPLKKFRANKILSEIFRAAGDSGETEPVKVLRENICKALALSQNALGRMLNNTAQPSLSQAATIAQVLGISVDSLISYEE